MHQDAEEIMMSAHADALCRELVLTAVSNGFPTNFLGTVCLGMAIPLISTSSNRADVVRILREMADSFEDETTWRQAVQEGANLNALANHIRTNIHTSHAPRKDN